MSMNLEESYKTIYGLNLATIDHNRGKKMASLYQNLPIDRTFQVEKLFLKSKFEVQERRRKHIVQMFSG